MKTVYGKLASIFALLIIVIPVSNISAQENENTVEPPTTGFEDTDGEEWTTHEEELEFLEDLNNASERVSYSQVGTTVNGKPIHLVKVGYPKPPSDEDIAERRSIMINATVHGNEPAGREMALQQMRNLAFTDDLELLEMLEKSTVLFIPTMNPDGREANTRQNAWGLDNNRGNLNLMTPETLTAGNMINQFQPEIVVDAHERRSEGADIEFMHSRNLNVYRPMQELNEELIEDYLRPDVEEDGFSTGIYPTPDYINGHERTLTNNSGLRHAMGVLYESWSGGEPQDRVDVQMSSTDALFQFYIDRFDDVGEIKSDAPVEKAKDGANQAPFYLGGSDNLTPPEGTILDPAPCGYLLHTSQAEHIDRLIDSYSIETEAVGEGSIFVTMNQPSMTVIPLLLDDRARLNEVSGVALYNCSDPSSVDQPETPYTSNLENRVELLAEQEAFESDSEERHLMIHLTAVSQFEAQNNSAKVVKHMKGFQDLLNHQFDDDLIEAWAYTYLKGDTEYVIEEWE